MLHRSCDDEHHFHLQASALHGANLPNRLLLLSVESQPVLLFHAESCHVTLRHADSFCVSLSRRLHAAYLLGVSLGEGQFGGHVEHDLLLPVDRVDGLRPRLTVRHIQTPPKPAQRERAPLSLQVTCFKVNESYLESGVNKSDSE